MTRTAFRPAPVLALCAAALLTQELAAQRGGPGRGGPPPTPRAAAAMDLTGYWVSVITEDWKFRMVTPKKGVYETLTLNAEGRKVGDSFDPARDESTGEQCRAYGAANIMRLPGRLRIAWADDTTLRIETDAGTQTRLFRFGAATVPVEPTWQGVSAAEWSYAGGRRGSAGSLKVVTTNLCLNHLERYRARWRFFSEMGAADAQAFDVPGADAAPDAALDRAERDAQLEQALRQLPPHQRVPLVLFHFEQQSYDDIARLLGVSIGKVKTDMHRGRLALRRWLS